MRNQYQPVFHGLLLSYITLLQDVETPRMYEVVAEIVF